MIIYCRLWRLSSLLDELAIYNDKGIAWKKHNHQQVVDERTRLLAKISKLIDKIGSDNLPCELIAAIQSGELEQDYTGKFKRYARKKCR